MRLLAAMVTGMVSPDAMVVPSRLSRTGSAVAVTVGRDRTGSGAAGASGRAQTQPKA
ncbi:hypothetical protein GCM10007164_05150 [Luteimonas padinae]|nr:hypothetical protein GCM10007164_05150 [Luteimonas padinae]